jgi:hypothetical protein
MSYLKIKDNNNLIRDESNNAIVNIDIKSYHSYVEEYKNKYKEINKMKNYDEQLSELKNEINDIKNILLQLVNKTT